MHSEKHRCSWPGKDPLYIGYHDHEWGVPVRDERRMFEFMVLETFQAGLSWITVLRKRENFRARFHGFDPYKMAQMTPADIEEALQDAGIIRNRMKVEAAVQNAKLLVELEKDGFSLVDFFWNAVGGSPIQNNFSSEEELPAKTALAAQIAKDLKKMGFKFMGATVVYAHLQAAGLVNDHITSCYRHAELS